MRPSLKEPRNTLPRRHFIHGAPAPVESGPGHLESFLEDPSDEECECDPGPRPPPWRKPPPLVVHDSIFAHTGAALPRPRGSAAGSPDDSTPRLGSSSHSLATSTAYRPRRPPQLQLSLVPDLSLGTQDAHDATATDLSPSGESTAYQLELDEQLAKLGLAGKRRSQGPLVWSDDNVQHIAHLGAGNGGSVAKVRHVPTGRVMAKKTVHLDAQPAVRRQILRELQIMHECSHPYIVDFYGAYQSELSHICMCMEYMDRGSLDQIYKQNGPLPYPACARVASVVVNGLAYLYDVHRILHRDVKPSNILANSQGQLKLCDFGVSGELTNSLSVATTFVGTSAYMTPERIQGGEYTVKSDIWSLGMTLIELSLGRFPFFSDDGQGPGVASVLDLLQLIVNEPSAQLPDHFDPRLRSFTDACLLKDPLRRPALADLLRFPLITNSTPFDFARWLSRTSS